MYFCELLVQVASHGVHLKDDLRAATVPRSAANKLNKTHLVLGIT